MSHPAEVSLGGKAGDLELPKWSNASIPPEERAAFLEEVTVGNLRRLRWFILIYLPLSVTIFLFNFDPQGAGPLDYWSIADALIACAFLPLVLLAQRGKMEAARMRGLVLGYYIFTIVWMTGYYYFSYPFYGENQSYTMGVLMVSVLFRLPPRLFLSLLTVNQIAFVGLLLSLETDSNRLFASMMGGINTYFLGCLAAHFLFSKEWQDFQKGRLLIERNMEMAEANVQLRARHKEMEEVMAIAAHDLRSPLVNVNALFELLQSQPEWQTEPYRRVLTTCGQTCSETLALINRLLYAHGAEHGEEEPCFQLVEMRELIEGLLVRFSHRARARSIHIEMEENCGEFLLPTDPQLLERVLENLLSNALKFSPSGTRVEVGLSRVGEECHITISDEGPGIPESERVQMFSKFAKGGAPAFDSTPGTGLGLFIVRQVIQKLGGSVVFEPRLPCGAIFRLRLPLRPEFVVTR